MKEFEVVHKPFDTYEFRYYENGRMTTCEEVYGKDRMCDQIFYLVGFLGFFQKRD